MSRSGEAPKLGFLGALFRDLLTLYVHCPVQHVAAHASVPCGFPVESSVDVRLHSAALGTPYARPTHQGVTKAHPSPGFNQVGVFRRPRRIGPDIEARRGIPQQRDITHRFGGRHPTTTTTTDSREVERALVA
jgi:hypothetical protein